MKKNVLLRTNLFICAVIILGFLVTSVVSFCSNDGIFKRDIEHISTLTSDGIYHQIDSIFTKPINISMTMANDSLLKTFLTEEETRSDDEAFIQTMRNYLLAYKEKYRYDSVFLVSARTNRYYHFDKGVDRVLMPDNPENVWYYTFLEDPREYALNIDNDEVESANNNINVFINCKIYAPDGALMGIVGVGFGVTTLQEMFADYERSFQLRAYLTDQNGIIEISTNKTGYVRSDLFEESSFGQYKDQILSGGETAQSLWYSSGGNKGFVISQYVPNLEWYLIIDNDTSALEAQLGRQFFISVAVVLIVIGAVLFVVTGIIRKYNAHIVSLTVEKEKSHRTIFQSETEKMYENIYELDVTHNRAANEATENYFESLGVSKKMTYDEALAVIAEKQIKEEYRTGYISTFCSQNVLKAFQEGLESLQYDFMITNDHGKTFYWMRITARIFYWKEDQSVRMMTYRQNIESEKQREKQMIEKMQKDFLSGLYNKAATQEIIQRQLLENRHGNYAFFILDIDNFKTVNDTCGHAVGDLVIADFAKRLKGQFGENGTAGRIGGDEFVVFVEAPSMDWIVSKAKNLVRALSYEFINDGKHCVVSASIGIAAAPKAGEDFETLYKNADSALYLTKKNGKNGYTVYRLE